MSTLVANKWILSTTDNVCKTPVNRVSQVIPYSSCGAVGTGYLTWENVSTSNTNQIHSFTYTPVLTESYIHYTAYIQSDRNTNPGPDQVWVFINNTPVSVAYSFPRVSSTEPWQNKSQAGTWTNTTGGVLTFSLRGRSNFTQYLGANVGNTFKMSNTIEITEYFK